MEPLLQGAIAVLFISLVSIIGLFFLSMKQEVLRKMLFILISLAAGALLGDAFIHLIPEAYAEADTNLISLFILLGIFAFFVLEKFLRWHHSHGEEEFQEDHARIHPVGHLVIASDSLHNFIDGLAIGVAFLISPEVGIATTLAIALHEIPQEIGDFGLLIHAGFSRVKALLVNFLSALTAFLGLGVAFWIGESHEALIPFLIAFAAGNFIYIALADLVPELHKTVHGTRSALQLIVIVLGVALMFGLTLTESHAHSEGDVHHDDTHLEEAHPDEIHHDDLETL